ncbi:MAG: zinc-binding dehydrogenase [Bacteroidetes bacterium]|jgi:threonine dehydrogenase-like Zn-dependent dehydrogenase|nr:zinc-binding dehydrogenase [Bacteroidota bacterium]
MKLLQITAPGEPTWTDAPRPTPQPGEVLVRVSGVTTCPHWDLHVLGGEPMFDDRPFSYPYTPGEPGHEAVGTVAALGEGVTGFTVGQRVAAWRDPGDRRQGCYAQYVPFQAEHLLPVPDALDDADLAPLELAMCVQVSFDQLMQREGIRGKRVGISGLGPSGLVAVQMAKAYGASEVVGFDLLEDRRARAAALGADRVMHPDAFPADRHDPGALDAALDTTGLKVSIEMLMARTRKTVALFGVLRETVHFGPDYWWGDFALLGYGEHNRTAAERALALITDGTLRLAPLVTHRLPLTRYEDGVALLRRKAALKVLFDPWADA